MSMLIFSLLGALCTIDLGVPKIFLLFDFKKNVLYFLIELRTNDFVKKYFHIIDPPTHFTGGQWWSHYINSLHVTWTWSILLQLLKRLKWQVTGRPRIMFYKNIPIVVLIGIIHENRADPFPSVLSREITLTKWHKYIVAGLCAVSAESKVQGVEKRVFAGNQQSWNSRSRGCVSILQKKIKHWKPSSISFASADCCQTPCI